MAGFYFKLQTVLTQRELIEQQRKRDLALCLKQRNDLYTELRSMQQTITDSKQQMRDSLVGSVNLQDVGQFARFSGQTTSHAYAIVKRIAMAEKQANEARDSLREATRSRKVIEILRDRQYQQWRQQHERRELAQLDETAIQQHRRHTTTGDQA